MYWTRNLRAKSQLPRAAATAAVSPPSLYSCYCSTRAAYGPITYTLTHSSTQALPEQFLDIHTHSQVYTSTARASYGPIIYTLTLTLTLTHRHRHHQRQTANSYHTCSLSDTSIPAAASKSITYAVGEVLQADHLLLHTQ